MPSYSTLKSLSNERIFGMTYFLGHVQQTNESAGFLVDLDQ